MKMHSRGDGIPNNTDQFIHNIGSHLVKDGISLPINMCAFKGSKSRCNPPNIHKKRMSSVGVSIWFCYLVGPVLEFPSNIIWVASSMKWHISKKNPGFFRKYRQTFDCRVLELSGNQFHVDWNFILSGTLDNIAAGSFFPQF